MGGASDQSSSASGASESISQSVSDYFSNAFGYNSSSSQNTSSSGTSESRLSQMQGDILQNRESLFQNTFFPEWQKAMQESSSDSAGNNAAMERNANAVNTAYDAAQKSTNQTLAQQGLLGSPTGVGAALTAANNRARSSALAQSYFNQLNQSQQNKTTLLNTMAGLMPSTTNSAEYHSSAQSQGTSESSGYNSSESGGHSESNSQAWSKNKSSGSGSSWKII